MFLLGALRIEVSDAGEYIFDCAGEPFANAELASNQHLKQLVVLVDVFVGDAVGFHTADEGLVVFLGGNLDADEGRAFLLVGLFDVLDIDQVVGRADNVPDEGKQCT